jgi:2-hydroxy-3-keto-5-methylthiopentenyl-1-phosphate phosphatase
MDAAHGHGSNTPPQPDDLGSPAPSPRRLLVLLDYDGTTTVQEGMEELLQHFVGDAWRPIEEAMNRGELGHAETHRRQVQLVQAPRHEFLSALVDPALPRPGLASFLSFVHEAGGQAAIVSAGFREAIEELWRRFALPPVEVFASELVGGGPGEGPPYDVAFNPLLTDCPRCGPRSCKAGILRALRRPGDLVVVCGDGEGDLCMAREADLTFAHRRLAILCAAEHLPWEPLDDFGGVAAALRRRFAGQYPTS